MALTLTDNNEMSNLVFSYGSSKSNELVAYSKLEKKAFVTEKDSLKILNLSFLLNKEEGKDLESFLNAIANIIPDVRERGKVYTLDELREDDRFNKITDKL